METDKSKIARVLVIDPDLIIGTSMKAALETVGHSVKAVRTEQEALTALKEFFDVVFIHRGLTPFACDEIVKTARVNANSAIILMSSEKSEAVEKNKLRLGADEIVYKPFNPLDLRAVVGRYLDRSNSIEVPGSPHILVVDDDEIVLRSMKDILKDSYDVMGTKSPKEALRILKDKSYEIAIVDLMMDEMYGMDFIHAAKIIRPSIVVIVVTGYASKDAAVGALREGTYDFLEKPLTPGVVTQTVGRAWKALRTELENRRLFAELRRINEELKVTNQLKANEQSLKAEAKAEKKRAEEWEATFNAITDMVSIQDKNFKYIKVNKAFSDIFKMKPREIIGKTCCSIIHGRTLPLLNCPMKQTLDTINPTTEEFFEPKLSIYLEISTSPILNERGELVSVVHIAKDITMRKKADEELKKAKETAEAASGAKSEFLANMSHEIRTPMNGIMGFTDILLEGDLTEKEREDALKTIRSSANNLLKIINDILDISKIESEKLTLEEIDFNLEELVFDVCNLVKVKLEEKPVEILIDIEDIFTQLTGDPTRLRQIIINLMGNSVKFTKSGKIALKVSMLKENTESVTLKFAVQDTGMGIPENKLDDIFTSFTQADTSTTRKFGGTGLGLSISKKLAELMGGEMGVESKVGEGSVFYFSAKFKKAPTHAGKIVPLKPGKLAEKYVLIIDNNKSVLEISTSFIENFGMKAIPFTSVLSAIQYLENCDSVPNLCILDIMMSEMNGYEFIKKVQRDEKLSGMPVIAASAKAVPGVTKTFEEAGFAGFVPKPVQKKALLNVICTVLGVGKKEQRTIVTQHSAREDILKNTHILLAEDNKINQKLIVKMLSKLGCRIDVADDGLIAMEMLNKSSYDLVFMDIQMPNMGGIEATKEIRKSDNKIPIIAMTANAMRGDRERCLEADMNDYLSKPVKKEDVIAKINEWR